MVCVGSTPPLLLTPFIRWEGNVSIAVKLPGNYMAELDIHVSMVFHFRSWMKQVHSQTEKHYIWGLMFPSTTDLASCLPIYTVWT